MKILHLLTTNQFSGAENVCLSIMNILKKGYIQKNYLKVVKHFVKNKSIGNFVY